MGRALMRRLLQAATAIGIAAGLSGCHGTPALQPFATDGCSMFPDRALAGTADWCSCCIAHDLAYWRGGSAAERLAADRELAQCVQASSHDPILAQTMLAGVRAGCSPYFVTPYRWGYGWSYGRLYQPLDAREEAQASTLRARYLAGNPDLSCSKPGS